MGSRLAHLTEAAIQDAFLKLLSEQPFDKITVTQLVEECQITRRTFYYHYSDLYELLDIIRAARPERALGEFETTGSWEECMITASRFAREPQARRIPHLHLLAPSGAGKACGPHFRGNDATAMWRRRPTACA